MVNDEGTEQRLLLIRFALQMAFSLLKTRSQKATLPKVRHHIPYPGTVHTSYGYIIHHTIGDVDDHTVLRATSTAAMSALPSFLTKTLPLPWIHHRYHSHCRRYHCHHLRCHRPPPIRTCPWVPERMIPVPAVSPRVPEQHCHGPQVDW